MSDVPISIRGFTKRFNRVVAVEDFSLDVMRGQITALLGPNGSGKSTTLKAVVGLVTPTSGRISVEGIEVARSREKALAHVSYLPQRVHFPESLSGREVLQFYADLRRLPAGAVPSAARVAGLNGDLDRVTGEYSGGMLQRLGLAVLALPDAPLLLLDEPTAGLDPSGIQQFNRWLREQSERGKTIVFTTHRLEDAEDLAHRVVILVRGRMVADMTSEELRQRETVEVWLRLSRWDPRFQAVAEEMGAVTLCIDESGDFIFAAPGPRAIEIMKRLRGEGADIYRFTSRSSLDRFYHEITRERTDE